MAIGNFTSNQGTQTPIAIDSIGGGTVMAIQKIDLSPLGASGTIWGGAVTVTSGSINGTVNQGGVWNIGTIGTLGLGTVVVSSIGTIGTLGLGTITGNLGTIGTLGLGSVVVNSLPNTPGGTLGLVSAIGTIGTLGLGTITGNLGTIGTLGTVSNVGSISNIGTLTQISGTAALADGMSNPTIGGIQAYLMGYNGSTWDRLHEVFLTSDNSGVQTGLYTLPQNLIYNGSNWDRLRSVNPANGGTGLGLLAVSAMGEDSGGTMHPIAVTATSGSAGTIILPNIPGGTLALVSAIGTMGTLGTVSNIGQVYNAGTLQAGTVQINQLPTQAVTVYGTMGTQASGTTFFTIQGTVGAGTEAIVSDWSIVVMSGTCGVSLSFGTNSGTFVQGTGVIAAGSFPAGGGIAQSVESALNSGTNGAIYAGLYGNGTAYYHVSYYKATTTV